MMLALLVASALASGTSSPKPPTAPVVDLTSLPGSARMRPVQVGDAPHPVMLNVLADRDSVAPGGSVRIGLLLEQSPGWHTYWRSPGDVGQATTIEWVLPDGAEAGEFTFPVPQRFDLGGEVSFGYDDQVLLWSRVALPEDLPAGTTSITARATWLVCEEMCIRGTGEVTLPLAVGVDSGPNAYATLFDHYTAQHPVKLPDGLVVTTTVDPPTLVGDKPITVTVRVEPGPGHTLGSVASGASWPAFTPIVPGEIYADSGTELVESLPGGGFVATVRGDIMAADPIPDTSVVGGLVQVTLDGKPYAVQIEEIVPWATPGVPAVDANPAVAAPPTVSVIEAAAPTSFGAALVFAFLGGLLLNVMPCVLPVLTLKLYGLVEGNRHGPAEQRKAGLAYAAGVLASFAVLAAVVYTLRVVMGAQIGWGFQFQSPAYVAALGAIVFAFGLSLFGVFEIPLIGANTASDAAAKEGHAGHFFAGVFAAVLGTPCSAPFLAPAVGYAFSQSDLLTISLFFLTIGAGLAAPFVIVAFVPALFAWMPQPGAWMDTFKKAMGFTLLATAVWLVDVFGGLVGPEGGAGYLWFLLTLGVGAFVFGQWGSVVETTGRQALAGAVGLAITAAGGWAFLELEVPPPEPVCETSKVQTEGLDFSTEVPWQPFTELAVASTEGHPVFIDFTAKWCLTCKVTEKTVIQSAAVRTAMKQHGIVPLKADWTRYDPVITAWLERNGRAGVPFWLVIPADRSKPQIALPDAMTQQMLIDALAKGAM